jgi:hypothetical protein
VVGQGQVGSIVYLVQTGVRDEGFRMMTIMYHTDADGTISSLKGKQGFIKKWVMMLIELKKGRGKRIYILSII